MEPIEREIVDVVLSWSPTWTDWPTADSTSLREEAVRLLIRAGMLERRIAYSVLFTPPPDWWSRLRGVRSAEGFELVVQVSGHDWSKRFEAVLGKIFPSHWFDADKLVGRVDLHQTRSQVRLTDQGELAREHLEAGAFNNVLDYVLRRSLYDWYPRTTSRVDIVSRSDPSPIALRPTANAVAVASANANASVGNITTVINNGFDLSGIEKALGGIATALDKGKPTNDRQPSEPDRPPDKPPEALCNQDELPPAVSAVRGAYEWAMSKISGADDMTIPQLFEAIQQHSEMKSEFLDLFPDNADTFGRYLRRAGIRRYNTSGHRARRSSRRPKN